MWLIRCSIYWLLLAAGAVFAQEDSGDTVQLTDTIGVNNYYAEQAAAISQAQAEKLTEIDKTRGEALDTLAAEYAKRIRAIFADNSAAHKALGGKGLAVSERDAETARIQAEMQQARAELDAWREAEWQAVAAEHAAQREAQFAATRALYEKLQEQRNTTLQRLLSGPVRLPTLQPIAPPPGTATADSSEPESDAETSTDGLEMLTRADDEQAHIRTGDDASGSGEDSDGPSPGDDAGGLEMLTRADETTAGGATEDPEDATAEANFIQTTQARAHTVASASSQRREPDCEGNPDADWDGVVDHRCGGADCDDNNPDRYPGNTEIGNLIDEDCDPDTLGDDGDGDGFISAFYCNGEKCGGDCDDAKASVYPGASEVCNHIDDNCDGNVDDGVLATKYLDRDGDSYGDPAAALRVCAFIYESPYGDGDSLSERGTDCDDSDPTIWQGCLE